MVKTHPWRQSAEGERNKIKKKNKQESKVLFDFGCEESMRPLPSLSCVQASWQGSGFSSLGSGVSHKHRCDNLFGLLWENQQYFTNSDGVSFKITWFYIVIHIITEQLNWTNNCPCRNLLTAVWPESTVMWDSVLPFRFWDEKFQRVFSTTKMFWSRSFLNPTATDNLSPCLRLFYGRNIFPFSGKDGTGCGNSAVFLHRIYRENGDT